MGDATNNGTVGAIRTGDNQIVSQTIPDINTSISNNNTFIVGNPNTDGISITFINQAPTLTATPQINNTQRNQPFTFTLADLNPVVNDVNEDNTRIRINTITAGTLTRNGIALSPGDTINRSDVLVYTPPQNVTGSVNSFTIRATDNVSTSAPVQIAINVTNPPQPPQSNLPNQLPLNLQPENNQVLLIGEPLYQSPSLTELAILQSVLPEPSLLLKPPTQWEYRSNSAGSGVSRFSRSTLNKLREPTRPIGTTGLRDITPDLLITGVPDISTPDIPSNPNLPISPPIPNVPNVPNVSNVPEPKLPSATPQQTSLSPSLSTDTALSPSSSTEQNETSSLEQNTQRDSAIAQKMQDCQQKVKEINKTAAANRTQGNYTNLIECYQQN